MKDGYRRPLPRTATDLMREIPAVIRPDIEVAIAATLLDEIGILPVVDSRGRCVGLFTTADYQRWLHDQKTAVGSAGQSLIHEEVRYRMTMRFTVATPDMSVDELVHQLEAAEDPYVIVLDRQARPRGIVLALDLLVAKPRTTRATRAYSLAN